MASLLYDRVAGWLYSGGGSEEKLCCSKLKKLS